MSWVNASQHGSAFAAVLLDRDGTLIFDEPCCGDPSRVRPVDGAREALDALRASGLALGVITNQSGIGRGRLSRDQVDTVNARVEEFLGPFGTWQICPHSPEDGCACRLVDHPCLSGVDPQDVVAAVRRLTAPVAGGPA